MKISPFLRSMLFITIIALVLASCKPEIDKTLTPPLPSSPGVGETESPVVSEPTATETEPAPSVLNVCIASEPASLYRYDGRNSLSKESIFAALYGHHDGSALLQSIPGQDDAEDISQEAVTLEQGMMVLAADGTVQVLKRGTRVFAAGQNEITVWDTDLALEMKRSTIIYRLYDNQLWSDGTPLTAHDVLYSYHLARRLGLPSEQWALDRTANLEAIDEHTLRWTGIPGFIASDAMLFFWKPLPAHIFETLPDEDLLNHPMASLTPPGWGAWRISDWQKGAQFAFEKNPNYFHADTLQAEFEFLNFIVVSDFEQALSMLEQDECQILDKSYQLESLDETRLNDLTAKYQLVIEDFELTEQLVFGIRTAEDAFALDSNLGTVNRANFFGDQTIRQAVAACLIEPNLTASLLNKEWIASNLPSDVDIETLMPLSIIADPKVALTEAGWVLTNGSAGTRVASGVLGVEDGTAFEVTLLSGQSAQSHAIATRVVQQLAECGIAVTHQSMPAAQLYAPGPEAPLFGRQFDMAIVNWGQLDYPLCELYNSGQIPHANNYWIGTNIAGLNDGSFDFACAMGGNYAKEVMEQHVPALPLMPQLRVWLASPNLDLPEDIRFEDIGEIGCVLP